ncbi:NAD(P)-dependent oxidoreductase [Fusobacterium nucleatum]|uniref:NAD(P)-dependent oxidoreductase n=1 Tax=Fusobacterium nucleatum TaxID=851 RepID=UPI0030CAE770
MDENALYKLLKSGHLSGAAMDVCTIEPIPPFHPLLELDNVVITPHIGVYTKEAISEVSLTCAKYIVETLTHINL